MLPNLEKKEKSTTESFAPLYRKLSGIKHKSQQSLNPYGKVQPSMETIQGEYSNLNKVMENLEQALNERMSVHQRQLLSIIKIQISKMLEDIRKVVKEKNFSQDLWETRNQVDYFKFEAVRLFQQNNSLRKQVKILRKQIQQMGFQQKCQTSALRNLAKKLAKEKANRQVMSANPKSESKDRQSKPKTINNLLNRHRNESLFSAPQNKLKITSEANLMTPKHQIQLYKNSSLNDSTLSNTKKRTRMKTQVQNEELQIMSPKVEGHSQQITMLNSPARKEKIRQFKQKMLLSRKGYKQFNLAKDQQEIRNQGN